MAARQGKVDERIRVECVYFSVGMKRREKQAVARQKTLMDGDTEAQRIWIAPPKGNLTLNYFSIGSAVKITI